MTTTGPGRLYRFDLDTLTGTRGGEADDFGAVNETHPYAIASHGSPAKLYMIGSTTDSLYTIDTDTGAAARVGAATGFGVGETQPAGLASHNGQLYMTGNIHSRLYRLNSATGVAESIGAAAGFGVGESAVYGIATGYSAPADFEIGAATGEIAYTGASLPPGVHTLYARVSDGKAADNTTSLAADDTARVTVTVPNRAPTFARDRFSFSILPGVDSSGVSQIVGTAAASDPENQPLAYSLRPSDPPERMYMTGNDADALYTIDSNTGAVARVGTASQFGVAERGPFGLAWHNGQLYMAGYGTNSLYTIDIATGEAALVATKDQLTGSGGPTRLLAGVASHEGELYVTTVSTGRLYRVDLDTLTGTRIGTDNFGTFNETYPIGIASHGSPAKLYMIGDGHDKLYTLDTDTGEAASVGAVEAFGVVELLPAGLASHNGQLYMTGNIHSRLYKLDTATGRAEPVGGHRLRRHRLRRHRLRRQRISRIRHRHRIQIARRLHVRCCHRRDHLHRRRGRCGLCAHPARAGVRRQECRQRAPTPPRTIPPWWWCGQRTGRRRSAPTAIPTR